MTKVVPMHKHLANKHELCADKRELRTICKNNNLSLKVICFTLDQSHKNHQDKYQDKYQIDSMLRPNFLNLG